MVTHQAITNIFAVAVVIGLTATNLSDEILFVVARYLPSKMPKGYSISGEKKQNLKINFFNRPLYAVIMDLDVRRLKIFF